VEGSTCYTRLSPLVSALSHSTHLSRQPTSQVTAKPSSPASIPPYPPYPFPPTRSPFSLYQPDTCGGAGWLYLQQQPLSMHLHEPYKPCPSDQHHQVACENENLHQCTGIRCKEPVQSPYYRRRGPQSLKERLREVFEGQRFQQSVLRRTTVR
jgi:hypothetical protein